MIAALFLLLTVQRPVEGDLRLLTTMYLPDSLSGIATPSCLLPVPKHGKVYVGSDYEGFVIAVDTRTRQKVGRVSVGRYVTRMLYVPEIDRVYCINTGDSTLTVIDPRRDSVVATVVVGLRPRDAAFCPLNGRLYCQTDVPAGVSVVDCSSNQVVARLKAGAGWGAICYASARNKMYIADGRSGNIFVIDCARDTVSALVPADQELAALCYSRRHDRLYFGGLTSYIGAIDCSRESRLPGIEKDWSRVTQMAIDDERDLLYAADPNGKVYVVDCSANRLIDTVAVGARIGSMVLDPVANRLYCALVGDISLRWERSGQAKSLAVIDCSRRALVKTVSGGVDPNTGFIARDPLSGDIYQANPGTSMLTVFGGLADSVVARVALGCRLGPVAYSPRSERLYVFDQQSRQMLCFGVPDNRLHGSVPIGHAVSSICPNGDTSLFFCVGGDDSAYLSAVDCLRNSVAYKVPLHRWAKDACFNPAESCIYIAESDSLAVLDSRTGMVVSRLQVHECRQPHCVPELNRVFAASVSMVTAIDGRTHAAAARIAVGNHARALYYDSVRRKLYCANSGSDNISVLDAQSYKYLGTILTLNSPDELVGNAEQRLLYCRQWGAGSVAVIDMDGDSVIAQVPVGRRPAHLVPLPGRLLCTSSEGGKARLIDTQTLRVVDSIDLVGTAEQSVWIQRVRRLYVSNPTGSIAVLEDMQ